MSDFVRSRSILQSCSATMNDRNAHTRRMRWTILSWLIFGFSCIPMIVRAEVAPKSDYRAAFSEFPSIDLPCIPQSKIATSRELANVDSVSVRFARDADGRAWLVISNDFPWTESFEIQWNGLVPEIVRPLDDSPSMVVDGRSVKGELNTKSMNSRWRCEIRPHSHAGWELKASEATIVLWEHRAESAALAMLESELGKLSQSLTHLTQFRPLDDTPLHGSFETPDSNPTLPTDWLVSLNPSTTWQVIEGVSRKGNNSIRFRSQQASAVGWIQSPAFAMPDGGRVAAEAWIHLDPAYPRPKIVATTTLLKTDGSRQDWKQTYQQNHAFDKSVEWHRIDFPSLNSGSLGASVDAECRVQLALDIEGPAQLWIDDICASKILLDEEGRRKLRSQLFVAQRELSQNRLSMAWQLTQSDVSRFVLENAPTAPFDRDPPRVAAFDERPNLNGAGPVRKAERQPLRRKLR